MKIQRNGGNVQEAQKLYEEAFAEGLNDARFNMPYALMLIRDGQYQKAKEFLVAHQKTPMQPQQRIEMLVYYATCCLRLGNVEKGVSILEQQFRKTETGLLYQTLGYLYVEKYDAARTPDFAALKAEAEQKAAEEAEKAAEEAMDAAGGEDQAEASAEEEAEAAPAASPEEEWNAGKDKAEEFIRKSIEYDDEDAICLDNMGQFLYRVREDKAAAKEYFEKAIELKPGQIDTLYFLSRYDLEAGDRKAALEKLEKAAEGHFSPLNYCSRETVQKEIENLKGAE